MGELPADGNQKADSKWPADVHEAGTDISALR